MKTAIVVLAAVLMLGAVSAGADAAEPAEAGESTNFDREADGLSVQVGAGLVFWFPFAHLEARIPLASCVSGSLFVSAGYGPFTETQSDARALILPILRARFLF